MAGPVPAQAADYVGLGDSYSSGTGTAGSYPDNCERTSTAYPALIASQLPDVTTWVNLSCSGARTQHITTDPQAPGNTAAQVNLPGLEAQTKWVTLEIGGNDAGFVDALTACGLSSGCDEDIDAAEEKAATELPPKLRATYDAVRAEAPSATILVVGYPRIFRPNQSCNFFFSASEVNRLNQAADNLDQIIRQVAREKNLAYVSAIPAFIGHGACDADEWINGLGTSNNGGNSYHPKDLGHIHGYAPIVLNGLLNVPKTTITSAPPAQSNNPDPTFHLSSSVSGSTFQCKLDGGAYGACASPKQYTGVADGPHTLAVRAVNPNGDVDQSPAMHSWTIDTAAPSVAIEPASTPVANAATNETSANMAFSSGDPSASFQCRLDGGAFAACSSPKAYTGLADGSHTFTVRAGDAAGNFATASRTWTVDATSPIAAINSGPGSPTPSGDAEFEFTVDDPAATTECRMYEDGATPGDFAECASPVTYLGLAEGEYVFELRATDAVGNESLQTHEWTVDATAPDVEVTSGPPGITNQKSAELAFTVQGVAALECSLDGEPFLPCTSPQSYEDLGDGAHEFTVRATDAATNVASDTWAWTVDTLAPVAAIEGGPPSLVAASSAELHFSSSDPTATFQCRINSGQSTGSFAPCTSPKLYAGLADGPHTFQVQAVDPAQNTGPIAERTWTVDTVAPAVVLGTKPPALTNQDQASFGFSSPGEPGASFECRLDSSEGSGFGPCTSLKSYSALDDGSHSFDVRAVDAAGNRSQPVSHSWIVDTVAPSASIAEGPPAFSGQATAGFAFNSNDPAATFQCRLDSSQPSAFNSCSSPHTTASLADGFHTFEVRAVDAAGNVGDAAFWSWVNDTAAPTVTIQSGPPPKTNQTSATFGFLSTEPDAEIECELDGAGFESCDTGTSTSYGDPPLSEGMHTFKVRVTDDAGHTSQAQRQWEVDTTPPAVQITNGPDGPTNQASASFGFTAEAGATMECRLDEGPYAPCGSSPKTYSGLQDGAHTVTVRATDAATNAATASRGWTVDTSRPETILGAASTTIETGAEFVFSSNEEQASFQCSLDGEQFAACSSPKAYAGLALGDHNFRVRAVDLAGNVDSTPASRSWRVGSPPSIAGEVAGVTKKPAKRKCKTKKKKGKRCKKKRKS